jgi:hypothetical protein
MSLQSPLLLLLLLQPALLLRPLLLLPPLLLPLPLTFRLLPFSGFPPSFDVLR